MRKYYMNIEITHTRYRTMVMARKSSLFQSSERFVALEVPNWLEEVLKLLEEVLNLPPNFSPFLLNT